MNRSKDTHSIKYDVAIIGSGPGGFSACVHLSRFGKRVCVIEKSILGGTCLNIGCIPTKSLVAGRHYYTLLKKLPGYGIRCDGGTIDYSKLQERMTAIVTGRRENERVLFERLGIEYYSGEAVLTGENELKVVCKNGDEIPVQAESVLLTPGSRPVQLPGVEFGDNIIDSARALKLTKAPGSMSVIGGGIIGCELAQIFASFGCSVTIVEAMDSIIPHMDTDLRKILSNHLSEQGITIITSEKVKTLAEHENSVSVVTASDRKIEAEKVLVCVGRKSNIENLRLENLGIKTQKDRIVVDGSMRTACSNIYAAGDIVPGPQLASKAVYEGFIAAEKILGFDTSGSVQNISQCIFTDPQIASIGMTEEEAEKISDTLVHTAPFSKNAFAEAYDNVEGFVKIICERKTGIVLGVHIAGMSAVELIGHAAFAVNKRITIREWLDLALLVPHPSYSECIRDAVRGIYCSRL